MEAPKARETWFAGFRSFVHTYGVLPLAVGVVVGNAINDLVKSLVSDILTPLIALIFPAGKLQNVQFTWHSSVFRVGEALNAVLQFLILAWLVYLVLKLLVRREDLADKK